MSGIQMSLLNNVAQASVAPSATVVFTTAGTTTWVAPAGVTQVEYLVVGGGGGSGGSVNFGPTRTGGAGGRGIVVLKY